MCQWLFGILWKSTDWLRETGRGAAKTGPKGWGWRCSWRSSDPEQPAQKSRSSRILLPVPAPGRGWAPTAWSPGAAAKKKKKEKKRKSEYSLTPFFRSAIFSRLKGLLLNSLPFSLFDCYQSWNFHGSTGHLRFLFFICSRLLSTFAFFLILSWLIGTWKSILKTWVRYTANFFFIKKCNTWWSLEIQRS